MARPTSLKVLNERPVLPEEVEERLRDTRPTVTAFPTREAPPAPENSAEVQAILDVLRGTHERMSGEVRQATAAATAALERSDAIVAVVDDLRTRTENSERVAEAVTVTTGEQLRRNAEAMGALAADRSTKAAAALKGLSAFAFDRLPALIALGSAFALWANTPEPTAMQLAKLGLYGLCVIGPAVWLAAKGRL